MTTLHTWTGSQAGSRPAARPCLTTTTEDANMADTTTYKIVRFREEFDPSPEVIKRGLTLEEAQAHCQSEMTHGPGWFDGYTEDTK